MEITFQPPEQLGINFCCLSHTVYVFLLWEPNTLFEQEYLSMWLVDY